MKRATLGLVGLLIFAGLCPTPTQALLPHRRAKKQVIAQQGQPGQPPTVSVRFSPQLVQAAIASGHAVVQPDGRVFIDADYLVATTQGGPPPEAMMDSGPPPPDGPTRVQLDRPFFQAPDPNLPDSMPPPVPPGLLITSEGDDIVNRRGIYEANGAVTLPGRRTRLVMPDPNQVYGPASIYLARAELQQMNARKRVSAMRVARSEAQPPKGSPLVKSKKKPTPVKKYVSNAGPARKRLYIGSGPTGLVQLNSGAQTNMVRPFIHR